MKTFQEWLKDKSLSEVSKPVAATAGWFLGGPLGAAVGHSLGRETPRSTSGSSGVATQPFDPNAPWWRRDLMQYIPGTDAHGAAQYHKQENQRKQEYEALVAKGMRPQDAERYVNHKNDPDFATSAFGLSYFQKHYPDFFK